MKSGLSRTPKGTKHIGRKRTLSGQRLPLDYEGVRGWTGDKFFVSPGSHKDPNHPSRKHDVARPEPVIWVAMEPSTRALRRALKRLKGQVTLGDLT